MQTPHLWPISLLLSAFLTPAAPPGELIRCDGRREEAAAPRKDSKGQWTAELEGKRVRLKPGDVVVVIDDAGKEAAVLIPTTVDAAITAADEALLKELREAKGEEWRPITERLAETPSSGIEAALIALAKDGIRDRRGRAIWALARQRTKSAVRAAAEAVLSEKDKGVRAEAASALFSVQEIYKRSDLLEITERGLKDADAAVRIAFAELSPLDLAAAIPVLKADGLKNTDHHVRESAAVQLGRRGDGSGETILCEMVKRSKLPGADDEPVMVRLLVAEQVEVCAILGKLGTKGALDALARAEKSPHAQVREAAAKALAAAKAGK